MAEKLIFKKLNNKYAKFVFKTEREFNLFYGGQFQLELSFRFNPFAQIF